MDHAECEVVHLEGYKVGSLASNGLMKRKFT